MGLGSRFLSLLRALLFVLAVLLLVPSAVPAQDHVATTNDLRNELRNTARERQEHITKLQHFLSSEVAQKALRSAKLDPARAQAAVPLLSDQELARLAAQVDYVDFAGGGIFGLTTILIVLLLVLVVALVATR
jgi:hypothetical protein